MVSANVAWGFKYIIAVIITLLLFAGIRSVQVGPQEVECAERGGAPVPHVRNFLCVDSEGHVIIVD